MGFRNYHLRNYNFKLILLVLSLATIGIFAVGSAQADLQSRQLMGVIGGTVIMLVASLIDYHFLLKFYWIFYIFNLILLFAVILTGEAHGGAQRWLVIGGLQFQPSELAKILLILFFAQFIMKYVERLNSLPFLGLIIVLFVAPLFLVFKQPDLSTSIMLCLIFAVILFSAKLKWRIIFGLLAIMIPIGVVLVTFALSDNNDFLETYQKNRILSFINPEEYSDTEAYQQLNSVTAIASGQLDGKGYRNNKITSVKNGNFLSQDQTDFIFAVIGEEFGFKGSVVVLVLLLMVALECIDVALKAPDIAGTIISAGMGGLIAFQSFINVSVATFIMPNTGLPLPFISYGLTSLVTLFGGIGIVLNIKLQMKRGKSSADDILSRLN